MDTQEMAVVYRTIADLFLHPEERSTSREEADQLCAESASEPAIQHLRGFVQDPMSWSRDEYVRVLELAPICPLYLGTYLFDEPTTCRGVGTSGRNAYMLELSGTYRHFNFQLCGGELPDYIPAMFEFCGISLDQRASDEIGLRRRFLERFILPGLTPFEESLDKCGSSYAGLIRAIQVVVQHDLKIVETGSPWKPPVVESRDEFGVQLAVLASPSGGADVAITTSSREEGHR
jgi:nitrate reductase assembly molybdenum cofactor insertion protein NarJ